MLRSLAVVAVVLIGVAALAQTGKDVDGAPQTPPTLIPEIPAGADPMDRRPDAAASTPAAKALTQPAGKASGSAECRVRRADTDTGFVVVCEELDGKDG